uniref:Uncharacterized protein n=1 Tax=Zea mays TaxID=4577 RepID=B4FXA5_MAIZE|nr:unknown [Zea mays]
MRWSPIVPSLHERAQLMQALGFSAEPQVLREAHLSTLQNRSAHPQAVIHLMRRTTIPLSKALKALL